MNGTSHSETVSATSSDYDVCLVGHVSKDIVKVGQTTRIAPGGTAYYTAIALKGLGVNVAVVTKGAAKDREFLLRDLLANKVSVFWKEGKSSPVFENTYSGDGLDTRTQVLKAMGTPFLVKDLKGINARSFHLGPLVGNDIPLEVLKQVAKKAKMVSLDVQGMVRPPRLGQVTQEDWPDKEAWLECVHVLKADETEAFILSAEKYVERAAEALASFGPREVIVTLGGRGSIVYAEGILHKIPGWCPRKLVDPTGCGDTYMAGYLYERLKGTPPEIAGRFAAAIATLKLEGPGPFPTDIPSSICYVLI